MSRAKGILFVISAPAGTGKTTLAEMLCEEFSSVVENVSYTTRTARAHEVNGKHYHFISEKEFKEKIRQGEFLEYAEVFGAFYGTARTSVEKLQAQGKHVLLVIDTQGAAQLRERAKGCFIFLSPPDIGTLRDRLSKRKTESQESIEDRLSWAEKEIKMLHHYDYHIINDNLSVAYEVLRSIVIAEEHRFKGE